MSDAIAFNAFGREPDSLLRAQSLAAERVFRSGWWILGDNVKAFETAWAQRCATPQAVGVANGLDAIEIGLRALGIGVGDEVITTPLTAYATTLAIQRCGATPVFADIQAGTACLDPNAAARCLSARTRAVLVVHLYGQAADLTAFQGLCNDHGLHLLEDCAQAHLAQHQGRPVGSIGRFGAWSFYPTKNLGAIGDAGALTTTDPELAETARRLRNYGQSDRYRHEQQGLNSRLDELQAALLLERLTHLQAWTERRRVIAQRYRNGIDHPWIEPLDPPTDPLSHVHHLHVLRAPLHQREQLLTQLKHRGIPTLIHYPLLNHHQPAIGEHRLDPAGLPVAENHSQRCFSLPIHPFLSDGEVDHIIDSCNSLPRH